DYFCAIGHASGSYIF
nr:immunoglobulin light chain junction region [Macaca mulatta]MOX78718.1 immunoglobulin light chain junction region [Macaca mulatta]MOX79552.1 immunoglobulin light chain junction region [Macaca mulatta]MOX79912.1 immunoglobulin light chain junction region [Macaca mulatta]MOX79921.1 immunoglobulin light chain junction region [Macaca mulatta]